MDKKAVHNSVYNFNVGEHVFLKKDFDTNKENKRLKFDPFFHPEAILKKFSENRLLIDYGDWIEIVSMAKVTKKQLNAVYFCA